MELNKLYNDVKKLKVYGDDENIKNEILNYIQAEILSNGKVNKGILTTFKRMIKNTDRKPLQQIYESQNGHFVICDGYSLIEYKTREDIPTELQGYINIYDKSSIDNIYFERVKPTEIDKTVMIDIKEVEKVVKYNKLNKTQIPFIIENTCLNAEYILNMIILSKTKTDKIIAEYIKDYKAPITMTLNNDIKAFILPIRRSEEDFEKYKNQFENIL